MKFRLQSLALAGLCVVILGIGGNAVWVSQKTNSAAARSKFATQLSDAYEKARFSVAAEESLERKYRLEPSAAVGKIYDAAAEEFVDALEVVRARGSASDIQLVGRLLKTQRRYRQAISAMFTAVDAGQTKRVLAIDSTRVDPRFSVIEQQVQARAATRSLEAAAQLHSLRTSERTVVAEAVIGMLMGLALLGVFANLLIGVNRRLRFQSLASEYNALHDDLTGLPNRRLLFDRLQRQVAGDSREQLTFSLLMIDLDRFKEINDTLGHSTGDLLLQAVGPRLQPLLGPGDTLARIGGDEFVILLPEADLEAARQVADRTRAMLRDPIPLPGFVATIDASIGIVTFPAHGRDAETLIQHADIAMYLAKARRSGDATYDADLDPYDPDRLSLIADLQEAVADETLEVHYQPKFDVHTLRPIGVEALARWNHPTRGMISPLEFIPLAEHTGLIKPLTEFVLRQAVRQCRIWSESGHDLPVAVNLSVANLLDAELVRTVSHVLREERVEPGQLQLEITESTIMVDPDRAQRVLLELAELGVALSVDDFGTGYSSLAYLRRLPIKELKIDRSFVEHLADDDEDAAIVRATIQLGHSLGLRIVAEGVEDARSIERLNELDCDIFQGFHLCYPKPPEALIASLGALDALRAVPVP